MPTTLYNEWANGRRWVIFRNLLAKISAPSSAHCCLVTYGGHWKRHGGCTLADWNTPCDPAPRPNSRQFHDLVVQLKMRQGHRQDNP